MRVVRLDQATLPTSRPSRLSRGQRAYITSTFALEALSWRIPKETLISDLHAARGGAITKARDMLAEGDRKGEDRRSWRVEVMDRANRHVLTVGFSEALDPKASGEAEAE